jgi:very-short-patch-repair endonuclease
MRPDISRAGELRRQMSGPEAALWSRLKRLRERGFHIRRQFPFRGYYLDFVCFSRRLVIEIDGRQHGDEAQAEHAAVRDRILERQGFRMLRVWTPEAGADLDGVMDRIVAALEAAPLVGGQRQPAGSERDPASRSVPPH